MGPKRIFASAALLLCTHCGLQKEGLEPVDGSNGGASDAKVDAGPADGGYEAGATDAPEDVARDASSDGAGDAPTEDGASDGPVDGWSEAGPTCSGVVVGVYCWYAGAAGVSCDTACASHGGCSVSGTVDYAGSGGTDANCVAVLAALGLGSYPHQNWSNNDLGCQFAWASWTYWSTALPTTCAAAVSGAANAQRMCACNQ